VAFCNIAAITIDNALAHQHLVKEKNEAAKISAAGATGMRR
jgi:hypothetical protein